MDMPPIGSLTDVEAVLERVGQGAGAEPDAAPDPAISEPEALRTDAAPVEIFDQSANRTRLEIAREDAADHHCFFRDYENFLYAAR